MAKSVNQKGRERRVSLRAQGYKLVQNLWIADNPKAEAELKAIAGYLNTKYGLPAKPSVKNAK